MSNDNKHPIYEQKIKERKADKRALQHVKKIEKIIIENSTPHTITKITNGIRINYKPTTQTQNILNQKNI